MNGQRGCQDGRRVPKVKRRCPRRMIRSSGRCQLPSEVSTNRQQALTGPSPIACWPIPERRSNLMTCWPGWTLKVQVGRRRRRGRGGLKRGRVSVQERCSEARAGDSPAKRPIPEAKLVMVARGGVRRGSESDGKKVFRGLGPLPLPSLGSTGPRCVHSAVAPGRARRRR